MNRKTKAAPWIILSFSLPTKEASGRVDVWRRLKRTGAVVLRGSGHLLPSNPQNVEKFEWIAEMIRRLGGEAAILEVIRIQNMHDKAISDLFVEARAADYAEILSALDKVRQTDCLPMSLGKIAKRLEEVQRIDYFGGAMREKANMALMSARNEPVARKRNQVSEQPKYRARTWLTRPRPGIDRVACAWLIKKFIDPKAKFIFGTLKNHSRAVPFDMYGGAGFGHRGEDCSFETLLKEFHLNDRALKILGEMIHDADLADEKFGRSEAFGIEKVLRGWSLRIKSDAELLRRGQELIDGLYQSIP